MRYLDLHNAHTTYIQQEISYKNCSSCEGETRARCYRDGLLQGSLNFCRFNYHFEDEVAGVFQLYTAVCDVSFVVCSLIHVLWSRYYSFCVSSTISTR